MTYAPLTLEDLTPAPEANRSTPGLSAEEAETLRLDGYEAGYKSGWDDANAETAASDRRIAADLERSLSDLSFTYEEARVEVLSGLRDLLNAIVTGFLPTLAAEAVLPRVAAEIEALLSDLGTADCRLFAAPDTCRQLEWLAERYIALDLQILPEPAYPDGRVTLRFAGETREIDLTGLQSAMTEAIRDFTGSTMHEQEARHA